MKRIEAQIMGRSYLLSCPEGDEARLRAAVQRVDAAMCGIRDEGKIKARDRVAVLAALNLAFEALADTGQPARPSAPPTDGSSANAVPDAEQQAALGQLLERMDQALGADGRLV
ncbi:MAG: cell division protein ZapA [Ottowia sp.]|nr:cell division protein ZapA [Ottowia sp.]